MKTTLRLAVSSLSLLLLILSGCSPGIDPDLLPMFVELTVEALTPTVIQQIEFVEVTVEVTREIEVIQVVENQVVVEVTRLVNNENDQATPTPGGGNLVLSSQTDPVEPNGNSVSNSSQADLLFIIISQTREQMDAFYAEVDEFLRTPELETDNQNSSSGEDQSAALLGRCSEIGRHFDALSRRAVFDVSAEAPVVQEAHDLYRLAIVRFVETNQSIADTCRGALANPEAPVFPARSEVETARGFKDEVYSFVDDAVALFENPNQ